MQLFNIMYIHDISGVQKYTKPPVKPLGVFFRVQERLKSSQKIFHDASYYDEMYTLIFFYKMMRLVR